MSILSPYSITVGTELMLCREGIDYLTRWPEFSGTQEIFESRGINENHAAITPLGAASVTMIIEVEEEYANHQAAMRSYLAPHLYAKQNLLLGEWSFKISSEVYGEVLVARVVFQSVVPSLDFLDVKSSTLRRTYTLLLSHEVGNWTVPAAYNRGAGSITNPFVETEEVGQPVLNVALLDQNIVQGNSFFFELPDNTFYDPNGDTLVYTASLVDGTPLPVWLNFVPAGLIFYGLAPEIISVLNIRIYASDGIGAAIDDFLLTTVPRRINNQAPYALAQLVLPVGEVAVPYTYTVPLTNFFDPDADAMTFLVVGLDSGGNVVARPAWIDFDPITRIISGTPTTSAIFLLQINVSDGDLNSVSNFHIQINAVGGASPLAPQIIKPFPPLIIKVNSTFSYTVDSLYFRDPDEGGLGDGLALTATRVDGTPLPPWLIFNVLITGFPPDLMEASRSFSRDTKEPDPIPQDLIVRVTATDINGLSVYQDWNLSVKAVNYVLPETPTLTGVVIPQSSMRKFWFVNFTYKFDYLQFSHPRKFFDGVVYGLEMTNGTALPSWLSYDAASNSLIAGQAPDPSIQFLSEANYGLRLTAADRLDLSFKVGYDFTFIIRGTPGSI